MGKQSRQILRRNPSAIILDTDLQAWRVRVAWDLHAQSNLVRLLSAAIHRLLGIADQVDQNLQHQMPIEKYRGHLGELLYDRPADNLTITPRILFQQINQDGFPFADLTPGNFVQRRSFNLDERAEDKWFLYSLTAEYHVGFGTVTSATSYLDRDTPETEDDTLFIQEIFDLSPPVPATITRDLKFKRFTQELRFVSAFSGRFQMVSGLFFSDTHNSDEFPPNNIAGLDAAAGGTLGTDLFYEKDRTITTTEYAAYTEGSYQILEHLKATAGLRVFHNTVSLDDTTSGIAAGGLVPIHITGDTPQSGSTPKFPVEYQVTPAVMTYASATKGYRIGGVNSIPPAALLPSSPLGCATELAAIGATPSSVEKRRRSPKKTKGGP